MFQICSYIFLSHLLIFFFQREVCLIYPFFSCFFSSVLSSLLFILFPFPSLNAEHSLNVLSSLEEVPVSFKEDLVLLFPTSKSFVIVKTQVSEILKLVLNQVFAIWKVYGAWELTGVKLACT